jgi:hypothetical protein
MPSNRSREQKTGAPPGHDLTRGIEHRAPITSMERQARNSSRRPDGSPLPQVRHSACCHCRLSAIWCGGESRPRATVFNRPVIARNEISVPGWSCSTAVAGPRLLCAPEVRVPNRTRPKQRIPLQERFGCCVKRLVERAPLGVVSRAQIVEASEHDLINKDRRLRALCLRMNSPGGTTGPNLRCQAPADRLSPSAFSGVLPSKGRRADPHATPSVPGGINQYGNNHQDRDGS